MIKQDEQARLETLETSQLFENENLGIQILQYDIVEPTRTLNVLMKHTLLSGK